MSPLMQVQVDEQNIAKVNKIIKALVDEAIDVINRCYLSKIRVKYRHSWGEKDFELTRESKFKANVNNHDGKY